MDGSVNFNGTLSGSINTGGGGGGGSTVVITPVVTEGTKIADVTVDGAEKDLYCPTVTPTEVTVTQVQESGTKIATIEVNGVSVDLYSPTETPTEVTVTQVQESGTKIATIGVNGVNTDIYAPAASGIIYSTTEQAIGTWIDGKILYRKTLNITTTSNDYYFSCADLNIDQLVNLSGYVEDNNNVYTIPINCYERSDFNNKVYYQNTNDSIYIGCSGYYPSYVNWVITIEYTKNS